MRSASTWALALLLACASAARPPAAAVHGDTCHSRIIVSFVRHISGRPDTDFVTQLARTAGVQLTFLRVLGPGLYAFLLATTDHDPACARALARLRHDARVRSAELDMRRRAQS